MQSEHELPAGPKNQRADEGRRPQMEQTQAVWARRRAVREWQPADEHHADHHCEHRKTVEEGARSHDRDGKRSRIADLAADRVHGESHACSYRDGGYGDRGVEARVVDTHARPHEEHERRGDRADEYMRRVGRERRRHQEKDSACGVDERQDRQHVGEGTERAKPRLLIALAHIPSLRSFPEAFGTLPFVVHPQLNKLP